MQAPVIGNSPAPVIGTAPAPEVAPIPVVGTAPAPEVAPIPVGENFAAVLELTPASVSENSAAAPEPMTILGAIAAGGAILGRKKLQRKANA